MINDQINQLDVWIDFLEIEKGDVILDRIEHGLIESSGFILILSNNSLQSNWVKIEANMAMIRKIEDMNYRFICAKIDDCDVPLRFKPYLYINHPFNDQKIVNEIINEINKIINGQTKGLIRRNFIDRNPDFDRFESFISDNDIKIIILNGFFGIGKSSFVDELTLRFYRGVKLKRIHCTKAHEGIHLCMELCAISGINMPEEGISRQEISEKILFAIETIISNSQLLVFDDFEETIDEEFNINLDFKMILEHISSLPKEVFSVPILFCSNKRIKIPYEIKKHVGPLNLGNIEEHFLIEILLNHLNRCSHKRYSKDDVLNIVPFLNGSPLIAKLIAPQIDQYSVEHLIEYVKYFRDLNIELSREILSNISFTNEDLLLLEILSVFDGHIKIKDIHTISHLDDVKVMEVINKLTSLNLIEFNISEGFFLHPILIDYFERQAVNDVDQYKFILANLSEFFTKKLEEVEIGTEYHIFYFTRLFRILLLKGEFDAALELRSDLAGDVKRVIIDLYHRNEVNLSLKYCEIFLEMDPDDWEVQFFKARNLIKRQDHGDFDEALDITDKLLKTRKSKKLKHFKGTIYRWQGNKDESNYDKAIEVYLEIINEDPSHHPSLRDISDCYLRKGDVETAKSYIERAFKLQPTNPYILTLFSEIIYREGDIHGSIELLEKSLRYEPKAGVHCKLGNQYEKIGKDDNAITQYKKAISLDSQFLGAYLDLSSILIDNRRLDEAVQYLDILEGKELGKRKKNVFEAIKIKRNLALGNIDEANSAVIDLIKRSYPDPVIYGTAAKIELNLAERNIGKNLKKIALENLSRARSYAEKGLAKDSFNIRLKEIFIEIENKIDLIS